jgi:membrane protease subunit (stomatin/prohibitin family)
MAMIDRVKWDGSADQLAWKFPSDALSTGTQLIVNESQEAFVVKDGAYEGPFGPGRHTLSSNNIPFLRQLIGLPFGGKSPFSAEVWFVNRIIKLDVRWGTSDPIQLQDPKFGIMVPVRAFGQYGVEIADSKRFLMKLVGTLPGFDTAVLSEYFRGAFMARIKTGIAGAIINSGLSVLEVATQLDVLSAAMKLALGEDIAEYGVTLSQFNIESINVPETDPAVQKLKAALARRAEMQIVGFDYKQERSFDVLQAAARNEGTTGALLGIGLGAGLGVAAGASVGQAFQQAAAVIQPAGAMPPPPGPGRDAQPGAARTDASERIRLLNELAQLRSHDILTDAEFAAEKARILAS